MGAERQGMVAGDLVNTASRVQSVADPGAVFVGASTRRATEQTVVYEEAGAFELKGKDGLLPLWRALRVVSGARGSLKSTGLEAPFVGRDRELRQIKDLFHTCAEERKAHLISVTGIAGIGKSRLGWEFYKYFDGLPQLTYWHRGRCLAYGDGVTYWALADMVRMRCRIVEDEEPATALEKLRATLEEHIPDPEERRFVEPRVAQLLGLVEQEARDKQELFAAWRLFFERLADVYPTVLAFEDMQWADASLLDFVEYLLEWSRNSPLYVITLARPELLERRTNWGAGQRNFSSLYLEPLSAARDGGAPGRARARSAGRAARADPRARRRGAAVRGRDGADAARPRSPRAGGRGLPAGRRDRLARGARDPARADRRPARRPVGRGTAAAAGRGRARQDVHPRRTGCARRRREPRSSPCSRSSCARRCSACRPIRARRSAASTASCRISSGTSPTRRLPSASAGRSIWLRPST